MYFVTGTSKSPSGHLHEKNEQDLSVVWPDASSVTGLFTQKLPCQGQSKMYPTSGQSKWHAKAKGKYTTKSFFPGDYPSWRSLLSIQKRGDSAAVAAHAHPVWGYCSWPAVMATYTHLDLGLDSNLLVAVHVGWWLPFVWTLVTRLVRWRVTAVRLGPYPSYLPRVPESLRPPLAQWRQYRIYQQGREQSDQATILLIQYRVTWKNYRHNWQSTPYKILFFWSIIAEHLQSKLHPGTFVKLQNYGNWIFCYHYPSCIVSVLKTHTPSLR